MYDFNVYYEGLPGGKVAVASDQIKPRGVHATENSILGN